MAMLFFARSPGALATTFGLSHHRLQQLVNSFFFFFFFFFVASFVAYCLLSGCFIISADDEHLAGLVQDEHVVLVQRDGAAQLVGAFDFAEEFGDVVALGQALMLQYPGRGRRGWSRW